jgi:hypothetical protein
LGKSRSGTPAGVRALTRARRNGSCGGWQSAPTGVLLPFSFFVLSFVVRRVGYAAFAANPPYMPHPIAMHPDDPLPDFI